MSSQVRWKAGAAFAALVGFGVAHCAYDRAKQRPHHAPPVSMETGTRPWIEQRVATSSVLFSAPWVLQAQPMSLPSDVAQALVSFTQLEHDEAGIHLSVMHLVMAQGEPNIEGAADGAINSLKTVPGTRSVEGTKHESQILDRWAVEIEARIERDGSAPLEMRGVIFADGRDMYQFTIVYGSGQSDGLQIWKRLRESIR